VTRSFQKNRRLHPPIVAHFLFDAIIFTIACSAESTEALGRTASIRWAVLGVGPFEGGHELLGARGPACLDTRPEGEGDEVDRGVGEESIRWAPGRQRPHPTRPSSRFKMRSCGSRAARW